VEKLSDFEKRLNTFADPNNRSIAEYLENMGRVTTANKLEVKICWIYL